MSEREKRFSRRKFLSKIAFAGVGLAISRLRLPKEAAAFPSLPEEAENYLKPPSDLELFVSQLKLALPEKPGNLNFFQEWEIARIIQEATGIPVKFELEGKSLPRVYGLMGTEQHLFRYPSDKVADHEEFVDEGIRYIPGAYGYFAKSRERFEANPQLKEMEKYYIAVQTWRAQDTRREFSSEKEQVEHFWEWFRYRKMLVVNPENGKMVVAVVGDAGPALWTGKDFGGSPEVMDRLGLKGGLEKGIVLLFFVDDSKDKIPLGPVKKFSP